MKKIAADKNYKLLKIAFRDPTLMTAFEALKKAGWSQVTRGDGLYFSKGELAKNNYYEIKVDVTVMRNESKKPLEVIEGKPLKVTVD